MQARGDRLRHAERRRARPLPARRQRPTPDPDAYGAHAARPLQLVIPRISDAFTVYAVDFPGMGWSDIVPGAGYEEPALRAAIVTVVEELGPPTSRWRVSPGATLGADGFRRPRRPSAPDRRLQHLRLRRRRQASQFRRAPCGGSIEAPVVGPIVARLETRHILRGVLRGGLQDPSSPRPLPRCGEPRRVGRRPGYATVARAILRNLDSSIVAREQYAHQRPCHAGLWRPRLVAVLGSAGELRVGSRRRSHRAARHRSLRLTGGTGPSRADPTRNPLSEQATYRRAGRLEVTNDQQADRRLALPPEDVAPRRETAPERGHATPHQRNVLAVSTCHGSREPVIQEAER